MFIQVNKAAHIIKHYKHVIERLFPAPMYFTINRMEYSMHWTFSFFPLPQPPAQNLLRSAESE